MQPASRGTRRFRVFLGGPMTVHWERAKELLESALALEPAERGPFLGRACGSDTELRAEVESLIAAYERDPDFIESPAIAGATKLGLGAPGPLVGGQVGPYRLTCLLGSGGMSSVYLGERTDSEYVGRAA